eukprot:TRINITY_DN25642_c0_g1_i1.p1 TRINITY_DN25642_c0_g1~~TRINITY_DN25642_c0_g1_i1.p1  ORF type:complete len:309 (-),score=106.82 TRINITY_DN25642_c0_g1_i1:45-971(-)
MAPMPFDSAAIAKRQAAGNVMAGLMNHQAPPPLRNHMRDNMRAIRDKERQIRGRKIMESQARAASLPPLPGGCGAAGPGRGALQRRPPPGCDAGYPPRPQPQQAAPLHRSSSSSALPGAGADSPSSAAAHCGDAGLAGVVSGKSPKAHATAAAAEAAAPVSAAPAPRANAEMDEDEMDLKDFEAAVERLKKQHGHGAVKKVSFNKGKDNCPTYLRKIQADLAEEKRRAAEPAGPYVPPGYRMLPKDEVDETLDALRKKRDELEKEFQKLPLSIQTDSQKRREKAVKAKIEESDKAIKMFSQPMVLVAA